MKNIILFLMVSIAFVSCEPFPSFFNLTIENSSKNEIACLIADGIHSGFCFPDTLLPQVLPDSCYLEGIKDKKFFYLGSADKLSDLLPPGNAGVLSVYIFNQHDVDSLGWSEISKENKYLVRYDLTEDDIYDLSLVIPFPPSDKMRNVRMFPRYETFYPGRHRHF